MKIFMGIFVMKNKTFHKKKILVVFLAAFILILYLIGRLVYLMVFDAESKDFACTCCKRVWLDGKVAVKGVYENE